MLTRARRTPPPSHCSRLAWLATADVLDACDQDAAHQAARRAALRRDLALAAGALAEDAFAVDSEPDGDEGRALVLPGAGRVALAYRRAGAAALVP